MITKQNNHKVDQLMAMIDYIVANYKKMVNSVDYDIKKDMITILNANPEFEAITYNSFDSYILRNKSHLELFGISIHDYTDVQSKVTYLDHCIFFIMI